MRSLFTRFAAAGFATALLACLGVNTPASAAPLTPVPNATATKITVPGTYGYPWLHVAQPLPRGWVEEEFTVDGSTFTTPTPLPYRTRILVHRPVKPENFNGTVIVEWLNVSGGFDLDIVGASTRDLFIRRGYAYVGVTAQVQGVNWLNGTGSPLTCPVLGSQFPKLCSAWDPVRYAGLTHPGDDPGSFDIFSEIGKLLRRSDGPLAPLAPKVLIATGQSQSAFRLSVYSQTIHNVTTEKVYDAFLLESGSTAPNTTVPTVEVNTEAEATVLGVQPVADTKWFRLWEVAGAGHTPLTASRSQAVQLARDVGGYNETASSQCAYFRPVDPPVFGASRVEDVLKTGIVRLELWAKHGIAAQAAPRLQRNGSALVRDSLGNAVGGIRLPEVQAPVLRLVGVNVPAPGATAPLSAFACPLLPGVDFFNGEPAGLTPADAWNEPAKPLDLYGNRGRFLAKFLDATLDATLQGFVLPEDALDYAVDAAQWVSTQPK